MCLNASFQFYGAVRPDFNQLELNIFVGNYITSSQTIIHQKYTIKVGSHILIGVTRDFIGFVECSTDCHAFQNFMWLA